MRGYAPILLLVLIALVLPPLVWTISKLLRPTFPSANKYSAYECGILSLIHI